MVLLVLSIEKREGGGDVVDRARRDRAAVMMIGFNHSNDFSNSRDDTATVAAMKEEE